MVAISLRRARLQRIIDQAISALGSAGWAMKSAIGGGISPRSAHAWGSSVAISSLTSRDQPSWPRSGARSSLRPNVSVPSKEESRQSRGAGCPVSSDSACCPAGMQQMANSGVVGETESSAMPHDQEFLLYPLDTGEDPACPRCGTVMLLAAAEVHNDRANILTFRCGRCGRSERLLHEEE